MTAAISSRIRAAGTNPHKEFLRVQAESRRIRLEFLQIELALSCTIATFPQPGDSQYLKEKCHSTALKAYNTVRSSLLYHGANDELEAQLDRLRSMLANEQSANRLEIGSSTPHEVQGAPPSPLTPREIEVLKHIAEGHSSKQVAGILGIAFRTVVCHRYRIMNKLGIHETAGLVRYAIREGMIRA